jgi:hypothetical protein
MLNTRHRISPRVLIKEQAKLYTSHPLSKVEHDAAVSAAKLTGIPDLLKRYADDAVRFALSDLSASI